MRKVKLEKVIEIYSLQEMLDDEEKKANLLEFNKPCESDIEGLCNYWQEDIEDQLKSEGWENPRVRFDISYSQGSGLSFSFDNVDLQRALPYCYRESIQEDFERRREQFPIALNTLIRDDQLKFVGTFNFLSNHYNHARVVDVRLVTCEVDDGTERSALLGELIETSDFKEYLNSLEETVQDLYEDRADYYYGYLKNKYEYMHSEEGIKENLLGNDDLEFTTDGKCFKPDIFEYPEYTITPIEREELWVIVDEDGKVFSHTVTPWGFLDTVDDPDMGYEKAVKFESRVAAEQAYLDFIAKSKDYSDSNIVHIVEASEAFKVKENTNGNN